MSDNALNAVGGTQTIPWSGSGTSGTGGNVVLAVLAMGPGGVLQGVVAPNQSPAGTGNPGEVWVDTTHRTFVLGGVYLQLDSQGNLTCKCLFFPDASHCVTVAAIWDLGFHNGAALHHRMWDYIIPIPGRAIYLGSNSIY